MSGTLALVGGNEWRDGCSFDGELLDLSGTDEVVVLPTAAAYEHPARAVEQARAWFERVGAKVVPVMALARPDASDPLLVDIVRSARFLYLGGGSPLHLRSVLKASPLWDALVAAWEDGAVLAASSAGAMVIGDPMVDPRGGAFTLGLGLLPQIAVLPHHESWPAERRQRTLSLASRGVTVLGIDERTAAIRDPDGTWRSAGAGLVEAFRDGEALDVTELS